MIMPYHDHPVSTLLQMIIFEWRRKGKSPKGGGRKKAGAAIPYLSESTLSFCIIIALSTAWGKKEGV